MPSLDSSSMVIILPELIILLHNDTGEPMLSFEVGEIRNEVYHLYLDISEVELGWRRRGEKHETLAPISVLLALLSKAS